MKWEIIFRLINKGALDKSYTDGATFIYSTIAKQTSLLRNRYYKLYILTSL